MIDDTQEIDLATTPSVARGLFTLAEGGVIRSDQCRPTSATNLLMGRLIVTPDCCVMRFSAAGGDVYFAAVIEPDMGYLMPIASCDAQVVLDHIAFWRLEPEDM